MSDIGTQGFRLLFTLLILGISVSPAFAYLDPGTGSILLQVLLGGVAGLAVAGKLFWHKLLNLVGVRKEGDFVEDRGGDVDARDRK
jgi:hypothetical protein